MQKMVEIQQKYGIDFMKVCSSVHIIDGLHLAPPFSNGGDSTSVIAGAESIEGSGVRGKKEV